MINWFEYYVWIKKEYQPRIDPWMSSLILNRIPKDLVSVILILSTKPALKSLIEIWWKFIKTKHNVSDRELKMHMSN